MVIEGWMIGTAISLIGTGGGFVVNAAYLKGVFGTKIEENERDIRELKKSVVYADTCGARHEEINRRFDRAERALNGSLKGAK